ncbi:EF-hand domain-containing protein [Nocardiopsis dassonvillei]|jgi:Ca2+-binding EF-hand superfamily protein|uniref:EF-hand domain-containing protein n=1 Tax=Nocardiopsis dassonvillei TaxID=2014 RepID=UPI00102AB0F5|nr:EF-hand domain-containing protein [Nocardiopsis dassonvillei]MCP3011770.1 EF-hand domain-containing protein [Nocardiopsis dassonvillei]
MTTATKANSRLEERFRLWDANGNGAVERSDFESEANDIVSRLGAEGTAQGNELKSAYLAMFDHLASAAGTQSMSQEQFMQAAEQEIISKGDAGFASVVQPTIQAIVNVLDVDGDGEISPTEMQKWFAAIGLQGADADRAFADLDADGSGKLSTSELVDAVRDYHLGRNDIPLLGS